MAYIVIETKIDEDDTEVRAIDDNLEFETIEEAREYAKKFKYPPLIIDVS